MNRVKGRQKISPKPCKTCGKLMEWRKAWAKNWEKVLYCSTRCQKGKR